MSVRDLFREGDWLGDYEICGRLRAGGMATLFLAQRHGAAGVLRPVVIKVIHPHLAQDPSIVRMFIDEARISSHIRHSNVVYVEKFGEHDGVYYIVMEYVDGCSLYQVLHACKAEGRKLSPALAVHIAIEVAAGLHAAHETTGQDGAPLGIVHRDVSPSNVLLTRDGRIKVIDFGIAKARGRLGDTHSGSGLKGKLRYMAPEQAWGQSIDRRTDVYALGICLWELLTCRQLFRAKDDLAVLELVRNPVVPPPSVHHPEVPLALDAIVLRATAKRPEDRHHTAFELRRDLMLAVPGAVAIPTELVADLVHHVCVPDRAATVEHGTETTEDATDPSSVVPGSSFGAVVGAVRPRGWRHRGLAFAGAVAVCAIGIVIAVAGRSNDDARASVQPAQAVDGSSAALTALDAGVAVVAKPIPAPSTTAPPTVPPTSEPPPAPATRPTAEPTVAPPTGPTPVAEPTREPPARPTPAEIRVPSRRPPRPTPRADEGRVTSVEADGAVLADEPTPRTVKPAGKPTKPPPRPANAVQADGAVLAQ